MTVDPENHSGPIILYDENCPLCMNLAGLASRRSKNALEFLPWSEFNVPDITPDEQVKLGFWDGKTLYEGAQAWQKLLELHPDFSILNWAAEKLQLTEKLSRLMQGAGYTMRRLCGRCPRKRKSRIR